jgi:hypothetical protein
LADGFQPAQVQYDNCGRFSHPREHCFDLYSKLILGCGGGRGRGGGGGRGTPAVGALPTTTPPPTLETVMVARIEQLEQRLATMASLQHQSHSRSETSTSHGGDDLFYMASVA